MITLRKRGLPSARSGRIGQQHVQVIIEIPRKLTKKQREMLQDFARTEEANITPERKNFFGKLKDYFASKV